MAKKMIFLLIPTDLSMSGPCNNFSWWMACRLK